MAATKHTETAAEALERIERGFSQNDILVIHLFAESGIPPEEIDPRHNVLTFHAWKARGRRVAKGAVSLRVPVWVPRSGADSDSAESADTTDGKKKRTGLIPKTAKLFHISQTLPIDAERGTRPAAWANPILIRPDTYADDGSPVDTADCEGHEARKLAGTAAE